VQEKLGVETGLIYLPGQSAKNNEDSDMPAPFRQRRYFYYLSGFVEEARPTESLADEMKMQ
jgi:Xaa-Pro dipeptidase